MNSQNTDKVVRDESVIVGPDEERTRVLKAHVANDSELSIAEDLNAGGDPYNSTGRHVIIRAKDYLED